MKDFIKIFVLASIVLFSGCRKENLDFTLDKYYNVEQFLKSANCEIECDAEANCEGKIVKLKGNVDLDFAIKENGTFELVDLNNDKYKISVNIDSNIIDVIFYKLEEFKGKVVNVEGKVIGFDAPTNFTCDRMFIIKVDDADKISSE